MSLQNIAKFASYTKVIFVKVLLGHGGLAGFSVKS